MKRLTETDKWRDPWFRALSPQAKLAYWYLVDNCDNAGVIDLDDGLSGYMIGQRVDWDAVLAELGDRVERLESGKLHLTRFVEFQCGPTLTDSNPHKNVKKLRRAHGIDENYHFRKGSEPFTKGSEPLLGGAQDKTRLDNDKKEEVQEEPKRLNSREANRHFPESLNSAAVRNAWGNWLEFFSAEFCGGKPVNQQTADAHFQVLVSLGAVQAVQAVDNAILKRLRVPCMDIKPNQPAKQPIRIQT